MTGRRVARDTCGPVLHDQGRRSAHQLAFAHSMSSAPLPPRHLLSAYVSAAAPRIEVTR